MVTHHIKPHIGFKAYSHNITVSTFTITVSLFMFYSELSPFTLNLYLLK